MSNKIGRNDPCPCGSGLKYKKCCLTRDNAQPITDTPNINKTSTYIKNHESTHIINLIIGLQLIPENHGKNIRIENLVNNILSNLNDKKTGNIDKLKQLIKEEYSYNALEDYPTNLYSENVVFYGGTYTLLAGISPHSVDIFKNLSEVIFTQENELPKDFKHKVRQGISLILELGKKILNKGNIQGNLVGYDNESEFKIPVNDNDYSISEEELIEMCDKKNIDPNAIFGFILTPKEFKNRCDDPDSNLLLYYPIIKIKNKFYFILISNQANVLNEYIVRLSKRFGCEESLLNLYHNKMWYEINSACSKMNWSLTDIKLPKIESGLSIKEVVYQFDSNKLAYISLYFKTALNEHPTLNEDDGPDLMIMPDQRKNEVINYLKSELKLSDYKFLNVYTFSTLGREYFSLIERPNTDELSTSFCGTDFINLIYSEEWNRLSLWKFAKVYHKYRESTELIVQDDLDAYNIYISNDDSFYFSDKNKPTLVTFVPGEGSRIIKENKIKYDYHGALAKTNEHLGYVPVTKSGDYAPLYMPVVNLNYFYLLVESFDFPLWIINKQVSNNSNYNKVRNYADAIGFWLSKLSPYFNRELNKIKLNPFEIELILDKELFQDIPSNMETESTSNFSYNYSYSDNRIIFKIPFEMAFTFRGSKNEGERILMKNIMSSFNSVPGINLSEDLIQKSLDLYMPFGNAKMILMSDNQHNLLIDNRWLYPKIYISNAEINMLLDELPASIELKYKIPVEIELKEEKIKFFNLIVEILFEKLHKEIQIFENQSLIETLCNINEKLIWEREYNKILVPAQLICFGGLEKKIEEITQREYKHANTSIAIRCLTEFIAANPSSGNKKISYDDIDRLLTLMHEIINYGFLSDSIHFGFDNPKVGKLPSGRIGISKDFYEIKLKPFQEDNIREEVDNYVENFDNRIEFIEDDKSQLKEAKVNPELDQIDIAFYKDWGVHYSVIYRFCQYCAQICIENNSSVITINSDDLVKLLIEEFKMSEVDIQVCINRFSLTERDKYLIAPDGFNNNEVFPWKYNREFSLARRFIISVKNSDKEINLTWGFRTAISAEKQLFYLLNEGKLNNGGKEIKKLLGKFRERKGKIFRDEVKDWLKNTDGIILVEYEVDIAPNGNLIAESRYGDIDILFFEKDSKIAYSIECKNINKAKNIHEMKKEMDNFLGREDGKGMINKHVQRDKWLNENKHKVMQLLNVKEISSIKSFVITSEVVPTAYINQGELLLPIISYSTLKKDGLKVLRQ
uniref:YecA family protein n=1 Tax=uncultured Draconibacterium sp. TaxID=1573823 RepID=UPI003216986B